MRSASACAILKSSTKPIEPGVTGTPAVLAVSLAVALSPICLIVSGAGPMNVMCIFSHIVAKVGFSDKNPKPGWMASAPVIEQAANKAW